MWRPFKRKIKFSRYGWRPDLPDHRDHLFSTVFIRASAPLPQIVDLRSECPAVVDQMALGSCTANAITAAVEFLDIKDKIPELALSRLFLYYNERAAEGTINYDSGASLRDGIKVLADQGVCQESLWPYDINKFTSKPSDECYQAAQAHKAIVYQRLTTLNDMRACLAAGFPLVFGITVYESFESDQVAKSGIVPMPSKSERSLGGHALLAVGYNDQFSTILVRNSWGPNWGINGYFTLPYQYISNNNLADDFWTIRKTVSE